MRNGLCIGGDSIVLCCREVDVCGTQAGEDVFYFIKIFLRGSVLNENLRNSALAW